MIFEYKSLSQYWFFSFWFFVMPDEIAAGGEEFKTDY